MTAAGGGARSVAPRGGGPFDAPPLAALPTAASATYIILALEHPPAFVADSALGSIAANAAVAVFALSYAALAQRHCIGSFASGVFAVFPIVMGSVAVIMHSRAGGKEAASVFAYAQPPLVGLCLGFLGVHYLAEAIGVWWAFAAGLAITMTWSAALWLMQRALFVNR